MEFGEVPSSVAVPAASGHHWTNSVARHPAAGNGVGGTCGVGRGGEGLGGARRGWEGQ